MEVLTSLIGGAILGFGVGFFSSKRASKAVADEEFRTTPDIAISQVIASKVVQVKGVGCRIYTLKFVNKTPEFIFDVHIEAYIHKPYTKGGMNVTRIPLRLSANHLNYVPKYEESENGKHDKALWAKQIRFMLEENGETLHDLLKPGDQYLEIAIVSRHGKSKTVALHTQTIWTNDDIKDGNYGHGMNLDVS